MLMPVNPMFQATDTAMALPLRATRRPASRAAPRVLVIGCNPRTYRQLSRLERDPARQTEIIGWLDRAEDPATASASESVRRTPLPFPCLGTIADLRAILVSHTVDEVLVTLPVKSCYDEIQEILQVCEQAGVPVSIGADLFNHQIAHVRPLVDGRQPDRILYTCVPYPRWQLALKRGIDIAGSLAALTACAIPMLLTALAIKLTSRGPVFFRQERVGRNHRRFQILKFRTMVVDAEQRLAELRHLNEVDGPVFKIRRDPRITTVGRFLRKFSLDELPQFINVLVGDMSLVGPRPPIPAEVANYAWWQRRRLSMKPGITCYWQISGRNEIPFEQWMQMDLRYIDRWSLAVDLELLAKTVPAVLLGRGAS